MVALAQMASWWSLMLDNQYAFINADGIVVQVIAGALTEQQQQQFLRDYGVLYGATKIVGVDDDTAVWIGGTYTDGEFAPPEPEPLPEVITETII